MLSDTTHRMLSLAVAGATVGLFFFRLSLVVYHTSQHECDRESRL